MRSWLWTYKTLRLRRIPARTVAIVTPPPVTNTITTEDSIDLTTEDSLALTTES